MKRIDTSITEWTGQNAANTIERLVLSFPEIATITLASYSHLPIVQQRVSPTKFEREVIEKAVAQRNATHLPFWDCVMLSISASEDPMDTLLDSAATHLSLRASDTVLKRQNIIDGGIQRLLAQKSSQKEESCIVSEVLMTDGSIMHLPMMDFHCPPSPAGRRAATAVCKRIFPNGSILIESGESFHAYGLELIPNCDFSSFLGKSLLYSPIIDRAYIAHQLIEGRCALRISGVEKPTPITIETI